MSNNNISVSELNSKTIESMIYQVRGQKVMLDFELAKIYGYSTRAFNQQVQNNINKFDDDFMFQLNKNEWEVILISKKLTSSWGGNRKLPFAFTEQGIYMLMTDAGKRITTIIKIKEKNLYKSLIEEILDNADLNV